VSASLTDFSDVHKHGNADVVHQAKGGAICKEGIPQLQDTGQRELTSKEQPDPAAVRVCM